MKHPLPSPARIQQALDGDELAFEAVVSDSIPTVLGWCERLGGPRVEPEDAAHDILLIVVRKLPALRDPKAYPAWLFQITRKTLANRRRRVWFTSLMDREPVDQRENPEQQHARAYRAHRVQQLVDQLPAGQRQVVVLHDLEERSDRETAELLGISKNTVKSRLRAGRIKLRGLALDAGLWPALQLAGGGS